ncbi:Uncharacterised protein [Burkholderia pseudomallei]|nr:Uncharacterised protein [Burkholderia pseudomallei]
MAFGKLRDHAVRIADVLQVVCDRAAVPKWRAPIEHDDRMVARRFLARILRMLDPERQAGFGELAQHERVVGLPVLAAQAELAQRFLQFVAPTRLRIIAEHALADVLRVDVDEVQAIATQAQQREPRLHREAIAGDLAVAVRIRRMRHIAVPAALARARRETQPRRVADERRQIEKRLARQHVDLEAKRFVDALAPMETFDHERARHRRVDPDVASRLRIPLQQKP